MTAITYAQFMKETLSLDEKEKLLRASIRFQDLLLKYAFENGDISEEVYMVTCDELSGEGLSADMKRNGRSAVIRAGLGDVYKAIKMANSEYEGTAYALALFLKEELPQEMFERICKAADIKV